MSKQPQRQGSYDREAHHGLFKKKITDSNVRYDDENQPIATVEFDRDAIGQTREDRATGPDRNEADAWLRQLPLTPEQRELIFARTFDGLTSAREIAASIHRGKTWVYKQLNDNLVKTMIHTIARCVRDLKPLPSIAPFRAAAPTLDPEQPGTIPLPALFALAQQMLKPGDLPADVQAIAAIVTLEDIINPPLLLGKLKQPDKADGVSQHLRGLLSKDTVKTLSNYTGSRADVDLGAAIVGDLNRVIQGELIYDAQRFAKVKLLAETRKLLEQKPQGPALARLNRMLLEEAYPQEIRTQVDAILSKKGDILIPGPDGKPLMKLKHEFWHQLPHKLHPLTPEKVVELIQANPAMLLHPDGKELLRALVDLLEAASHGDSACRVLNVCGSGGRKRSAAAGAEALLPLATMLPGKKYKFPPGILKYVLNCILERVLELQSRWRDMPNNPELPLPLKTRLGIYRRAHGEEFSGMPDRRVMDIVRGTPLQVAAGLAEKVTGLSAESFLK